jgi:hypothetical protein
MIGSCREPGHPQWAWIVVVLWVAVLLTGLLVAVMSSRWAVGHLTVFAAGTRIPLFVIGITCSHG